MSFTLRPYQQEALEVIKNTQPGESSLVAIPTGGGKTICFASLAANTEGRTLIVVPSTELREQAIEKLYKIDSTLDVGSVQASLDEVNSKIVVASRQSLTHSKSTRLERMLDNGAFEFVVTDEAHQAVDQLVKIKNKINSDAKFIGVTATPYNYDMNKVFKKIDYYKPLLDMILDGYLCEPKALQITTKTNLNNVKITAGEFNQKDLEQTINISERNNLIVEAYKKYASDRKSTIIFASGISHSLDLAKEFNRNNIYCKSIDSTISDFERNSIIEEFKSDKLPVICNVNILSVGFDYEAVDCIIFARPTRSKILYTQILGRGLRLSEGKEDCLIIDIQDIIKNHDLMSISEIFDMDIKSGETIKSARKRIEQEELENEQKRIEEELKRKGQERKRQEELELVAKQIKLFNREFVSRMKECYYDWYRIDNFTYAVSIDADNHFVVEKANENEFYVYKVCTYKKTKKVDCINEGDNILEVIDYVENRAIKRTTSFVHRDATWKKDRATEKQLQYVKWAKTKWDAHKYFTANTIKYMIKYYKQ